MSGIKPAPSISQTQFRGVPERQPDIVKRSSPAQRLDQARQVHPAYGRCPEDGMFPHFKSNIFCFRTLPFVTNR